MSSPSALKLVVAGTGTGVGKTVFSAMLTLAFDAIYWKPVQSGTQGGTDTERVKALTELPEDRFLPEAYRLSRPLSPHLAAEWDGVSLDLSKIGRLPETGKRLVVELAGGLMVPLTRSRLQIDLVKDWKAPVVLVGRTTLGAINRALLSLEALQRREIPVVGVAFVGESNPDTEETIARISGVKRLGRLPILPELNSPALKRAFEGNFSAGDFGA